LTACWDKVLGAPALLLSLRAKQRRIVRPKAAEAFDQALYTLLSFARLCVLLGLEERSQALIERLVSVSCPLDELRNLSAQAKVDSSEERFSKWPMRKADVVTMQTVLEIAVECGLHAPRCWNDIIRS
uniref:DDT domain-containing protein n=1 Tax=Gongylonema pulchrum TaxID=637853 RepID=A0A183DQB9_9BILA